VKLLHCFFFSILTIVSFTIIALIFSACLLFNFALLKITLATKLEERMKSKGNERTKKIFFNEKIRGEKKKLKAEQKKLLIFEGYITHRQYHEHMHRNLNFICTDAFIMKWNDDASLLLLLILNLFLLFSLFLS